MFSPTLDMFDRVRLVAAESELRRRGGLLQTKAVDAARRILDLGVAPMTAERGGSCAFQVQPHRTAGAELYARADRSTPDLENVRFTLDQEVGGRSPLDLGLFAVVWFNLESLTGGVARMVVPAATVASDTTCAASVTIGRGGVVAAMVELTGGRANSEQIAPGFAYLH
ncbi:hypothetical protein JGU71_11805 [Antrihabitans sp. YC3-6]|uniref:Uncharacterized protein n=1 Tax=Antrihabitans stalagmiti TaxID=2799499 RepID=A0A934U3G2_9NOCA|nr:hypothetical protein [Antrihabitans stalagmiti]MBJ8339571.1 hypothetical protein [Antrihabitans stalagmiti]